MARRFQTAREQWEESLAFRVAASPELDQRLNEYMDGRYGPENGPAAPKRYRVDPKTEVSAPYQAAPSPGPAEGGDWDEHTIDPRIDQNRLIDNAVARYHAASDQQREDGRNWYNGARIWLDNYVQKNGGDYSRAAAMMAALSPQLSWEKNLEGGAHFMRTFNPEDRAKWQTTDENGNVTGATGLPMLGTNVQRAMDVYDSEDPRDVMGRDDWGADGPKIHSFWKNFLGDENYTTIDKHMLRALDRHPSEAPLMSYGGRTKGGVEGMSPEDVRVKELETQLGYKKNRAADGSTINTGYNTYADAMRKATSQINDGLHPDDHITPAQLQAIVWTQHKADMDAHEQRGRQQEWEAKNPGGDYAANEEKRRSEAPAPNSPKWPIPNYEEAIGYGAEHPYGNDPLIIGPQRPSTKNPNKPAPQRELERDSTRPDRNMAVELAAPPVPADNIPDARPSYDDMVGEAPKTPTTNGHGLPIADPRKPRYKPGGPGQNDLVMARRAIMAANAILRQADESTHGGPDGPIPSGTGKFDPGVAKPAGGFGYTTGVGTMGPDNEDMASLGEMPIQKGQSAQSVIDAFGLGGSKGAAPAPSTGPFAPSGSSDPQAYKPLGRTMLHHTDDIGYWTARLARIYVAAISDEEYAAHLQHVQDMNEQGRLAHQTTKELHAGPIGGYTPERFAAQEAIIDRMWKEHGEHIPRNRQAVMLGGLSGAGKGTMQKVLNIPGVGPHNGNFMVADPDEMKKQLALNGMTPQIEGLSPMETAGFIHEESSDMAKRLLQRAYAHGTNVTHDGTLANLDGAQKKIAGMRKDGYTIHGVFADIPHAMSVERATGRHRRAHEQFLEGTNPIGGRVVPSDAIAAQAPTQPGSPSLNRENFDALRPEFDSPPQIYDTTGTDPKVPPRRVTPHEPYRMAATEGMPDDMSAPQQPAGVGTYQQACELFLQGQLQFEDLLAVCGDLPIPVEPARPVSMGELYQGADGPDDDNSGVWLAYLLSRGAIQMDQLLQLTGAAYGTPPFPPKQPLQQGVSDAPIQ